jgi:hypothetical protein
MRSRRAPGLAGIARMYRALTDDLQPWRGVYALELPEEVLFVEPIDIRPERLDQWRPQGVTRERRVPDQTGPRLEEDGL